MKVRIDGYKHLVNKDSGEVRTVVYYSCEVNRKDSNGFIHCSPAWFDDVLDFDCGDFYNLVTDVPRASLPSRSSAGSRRS